MSAAAGAGPLDARVIATTLCFVGGAQDFTFSLAIGVLALTTANGCADAGPQCHDARTVKLEEVPATGGEVRFVADVGMDAGSYSFSIVPADGSVAPTDGTCWATLRSDEIQEDSFHDLSASDDFGSTVEFRCTNQVPYLFRDLEVTANFADVRLIAPEAPSVTNEASTRSCGTVGRAGNGCSHCAEYSVFAEALVGQGAPRAYPELVTPDFSRDLRVKVELGRVAEDPDAPYGSVCRENVDITAEMTVSVTADRYRAAGLSNWCAL